MTSLHEHFPDTVIRASAGTGKTFRLSNRYLGLLQSNQPPEQILASTFARKAAGEILERIMFRLAEAAHDEVKCAELETHLSLGSLTPERCATLLSHLIQHLHQLRVGTLDAFFVQTASHFSLEFGLPGGWTILEELDDRELRIEALRQMLRQKSKSWDELTTLIGLLQKGESARDVLDSLLSTIDDFYALFQETNERAWLGQPKLPTLSEEQVAEAIAGIEAAPDPSNGHFRNAHHKSIQHAKDEEWLAFATKGFAVGIADGSNLYRKKPIDPDFVELYTPLVNHACGAVVNKILQQTEATFRLLESFHASYQPLKLERRGFRFEDITRTLSDQLPLAPLEHVEFRLDGTVSHLLLDEFQDTSLLQWNVLERFAREVNANPEKTFFCVGDVKQAIYGWRGGISEIFDKVADDLNDIKAEPLDESRRSAPVIMDVVNQVFGSLGTNPSLENDPDVRATWQNRFHTHATHHKDYAGYFQLATFPVNEEGKTDKRQRARHVADRVAELHRQNPGCKIGVLTRTNQTVGRIIHYLRNPVGQSRDPVFASEEGGNPLTDSAAVIYILSLLKMAGHPGDLIARFNVVNSPLGELIDFRNFRSDTTAQSIASRLREQLLREGYGRTIDGWVRGLAPHCDQRELDRLMQLVELAWQYESRSTLNPVDFVRYVEETKVESPASADVRVMTVHQSKGLQFDIVVLPELDGNIVSGRDKYLVERTDPTQPVTRVSRYFNKDLLSLMPEELQTMFAQHRSRTINEALCLLYVAITRAVHALHVIVEPKVSGSLKASAILLNAFPTETIEPNSVVYEMGDPNWYAKHTEIFSVEDSREISTVEPSPIELAASSERRQRNLEFVKPSSHESDFGQISEMLQSTRSLERTRGSLIHAWLEEIEWLTEHAIDDEKLRKLAGQFEKPGLDIVQELGWFRGLLASPEFEREFHQDRYRSEVVPEFFPELVSGLEGGGITLEVKRELRIVYRTETELVNGIVDRVILFREADRILAADVIDYKTDSAHDADQIERLKATYRSQLETYGQAMQKRYGLSADRVVLRLGLTSAKRFVRL